MLRRTLFRGAKIIAVLLLSVLIGMGGLVGWLWLDHSRETMLPAPTGPYKVAG